MLRRCVPNALTRDERDKLIRDNTPYAYQIARRFHQQIPSAISLDDVRASALYGLYEASWRWNPDRGVYFAWYAKDWILRTIREDIRRNFRAGFTYLKPGAFPGREPNHKDLPQNYSGRPYPTKERPVPDHVLEYKTQPYETEAPPNSPTFEAQETWEQVEKVVKPREAHVLRERYRNGKTQTEIARQLKISPQWVSNIETRALIRLRRALRAGEIVL